MNGSSLVCRVDERRKKLFGNPDWNGLDYVEVSGDQLSLYVHFFGQVPENLPLGTCVSRAGDASATSRRQRSRSIVRTIPKLMTSCALRSTNLAIFRPTACAWSMRQMLIRQGKQSQCPASTRAIHASISASKPIARTTSTAPHSTMPT